MASKNDITISLGVEIDENSVNQSMSETEKLLSSHKANLEKSILKDFNKTVGGVSTNRLFNGNKNAHIMSMRDELGVLFKGINKSNTFTQMEKTLNKVADVFAKYETGFKSGETHDKSKNEWLNKYSDKNVSAFNKIYSADVKEKREKIANENKSKVAAIEKRLAGYNEDLSRTHEFDDVINGFNNNADGLNPFEDKNRAYLTLSKQRKDAKAEYEKTGNVDALKKYTSADQQLKALKDQEKEKKNNAKEPQKVVTQEQKAQNRELTDSIFKLSKILALWHLIRKAINNIAKGIKFVNNESQAITSRDIQEKGIFSIDAYSAMRANTDKTGAMIGRGLAFMGPSAPFSMTSFNDTVKSLQELRNKAMSGQGIQDEQQIISLQRISDSLGLGYNVASLMSNPNIDLIDFVKDLMRSVEKFLPKLDTLDDIKKSLLTSDFIKALGPELIDAISYNYNLNQRTGETASVIEKVLAAGAGAHAPIDFTVEANNLKTTMTTLNGKFDLLKQALENLFAGPLADFINNRVVPKVDDVSDAAIRYKLRQSSSPYIQAMGWAKAEASLNTKNRKAYEMDEKQQLEWLKTNNVKFSNEMNALYNKVASGGTLTSNEALQALLMPYAQSSNFGSTIESLALASIGQNLLKRFKGRTPKDVLSKETLSVDERNLLNEMSKTIPITQATISAATGSLTFLEGGLADWDPQKYGTNYEDYLRTAITALGYDYNSVLASMLTDPAFATNSNVFKEVSWTNDANKDKIIDSYITIKLVDTNNHTSYVRTKITDDMKQTFAAELH